MKTNISIIILSGIVFLSSILYSCKKENCTDCNDSVTGNSEKGFVTAKAGADSSYEWPVDSIMLDGSGSTSTIGKITQYNWTKVSGPNVMIVSPFNEKTLLLDVEIGDYIFELKARNSNGVTSTDLIKISITYNCNEMELQIIKGKGKITRLGRIPNSTGDVFSFINDNKIIVTTTNTSGTIENFEIFNPVSRTWSLDNLPKSYFCRGGKEILDFGNYLAFEDFGINSFSIYDIKNNQWTRKTISDYSGLTISGYKDFICWGGGINNYSITQDKVTLLNMLDGSTNTISMTQARSGICIVGNKNKVFFAGGFKSIVQPISYFDDGPYQSDFTTRVDIYDLNTKTWKVAELSEARAGITAIASGDKVIFSGGYYIDSLSLTQINSTRVDIYDLATDTWSNIKMIDPNLVYSKMYELENKILYITETNPGASETFSTLDLSTKTWRSISYPNNAWKIGSVAVFDNKLVISRTGFPIFSSEISNILDLYDFTTNTWDEIELSLGYRGPLLSDGKNIYLTGGYLSKTINQLPGCISCNYKTLPSCGLYQISF